MKKLLNELPGILNWSLSGLRALREKNNFTNTTDQETLIRELEMLRKDLQGSIRLEEYEIAARIRDKILDLEQLLAEKGIGI